MITFVWPSLLLLLFFLLFLTFLYRYHSKLSSLFIFFFGYFIIPSQNFDAHTRLLLVTFLSSTITTNANILLRANVIRFHVCRARSRVRAPIVRFIAKYERFIGVDTEGKTNWYIFLSPMMMTTTTIILISRTHYIPLIPMLSLSLPMLSLLLLLLRLF